MNNEKDNAGVAAPPPVIYLGGLIVGVILNYFFPANIVFLPRRAEMIVGIVLIAVAGTIVFTALRLFKRAKTNVEPWKPTTTIVYSGIYRFSRNPIYLAMTMLYIGAALLLDMFWVLLMAIPVWFLIQFGVILREEKYLTAKFGEEYMAYKKRVRRWL